MKVYRVAHQRHIHIIVYTKLDERQKVFASFSYIALYFFLLLFLIIRIISVQIKSNCTIMRRKYNGNVVVKK